MVGKSRRIGVYLNADRLAKRADDGRSRTATITTGYGDRNTQPAIATLYGGQADLQGRLTKSSRDLCSIRTAKHKRPGRVHRLPYTDGLRTTQPQGVNQAGCGSVIGGIEGLQQIFNWGFHAGFEFN